MARKDGNPFDLAVRQAPGFGDTSTLFSFSSQRELTRAEQRIHDAAQRQQLATALLTENALLANYKLTELERRSVELYAETADAIYTIKTAPHHKEAQPWIDAFAEQSTQLLGHELLEVKARTARNVGEVLSQPLDHEDEERRTFLQRLFGPPER